MEKPNQGNANLTATKTAWQLVINHPIAVNKKTFQNINAVAIDRLGKEKQISHSNRII